MLVTSFDVGRRNLAACVVDTDGPRVLFWHVFDLGAPRGVQLHRAVRVALDAHPVLRQARVVVEAQPSRNPQMRVIEAVVEAYFAYLCPEARVVAFSPRHKLAGVGSGRGHARYAERKRASVAAVQALLDAHAQSDEVAAVWRASRKRDDLADALLQALAYAREPVEVVAEQPHARPLLARRPREPDAMSARAPALTACGVKWAFVHVCGAPATADALEACAPPRVRKAVARLWPDWATAHAQLTLKRAARADASDGGDGGGDAAGAGGGDARDARADG
jgi:hypothetical protein